MMSKNAFNRHFNNKDLLILFYGFRPKHMKFFIMTDFFLISAEPCEHTSCAGSLQEGGEPIGELKHNLLGECIIYA